jgi:NADH-quinone oxidoreductase subunit L
MLFLGSRAVIEGCHHEQDIRKMGGLHKKMPVTCWTFFIGVLAIAGFGIPGAHLGLGGYFSKDEILAVAYERAFNLDYQEHDADRAGAGDGAHTGTSHNAAYESARLASDDSHTSSEHDQIQASANHGLVDKLVIGNPQKAERYRLLYRVMFCLAIAIAYITPFYMMRCWWLTFMGKPRDQHVHDHAHEAPLMWAPLVVLAVGTVVASYWGIGADSTTGFRGAFAEAGGAATDAALVVAIDGVGHAEHMLGLTHETGMDPHKKLIAIVGFAWIVGMAFAWLIYRNGLALADRLKRIWPLSWLHIALEQKLWFDHVYDTVLVGGTKWVLAGASKLFDNYIIDGVPNLLGKVTVATSNLSGRVVDAIGVDGFIDGLADTAQATGDIVRQPQTGRIRNYVLFGTAGASLVLIAMVILVMAGVR